MDAKKLQSPRGERIASRISKVEVFGGITLQSPRGERIASAKRYNPDAKDLCSPLGFLIL